MQPVELTMYRENVFKIFSRTTMLQFVRLLCKLPYKWKIIDCQNHDPWTDSVMIQNK